MPAHVIEAVGQFKYPLLLLLGIVEGPIASIAAGFFVKLGLIDFILAYVTLMLADLIGDIGWYALGYHYGISIVRKIGKFFSVTEGQVETVKRIFHKYHPQVLLVSKLTMGFGFALATLLTAGMVKIPFRRYIMFNMIGQFVWTGILMGIGYYFGELYTSIDSALGKASLLGLAALVGLALFGFAKFVKQQALEKTKNLK